MNKPGGSQSKHRRTTDLKLIEIPVKVSELVLTPLTCASIANEIIKCLVYEKSQIPYPYNWLKTVINRRRKFKNEERSISMAVERHYQIVSAAYDALEDLMRNLCIEFKDFTADIKQVLIIFGSTVYTPKEVFSIRLSGLATGHSEDNHLHSNSKNLHKILKNIVLAEEWVKAMELAVPPTNMYVMLQKYCKNDKYSEKNVFQPNIQYSPPSEIVKHTVIQVEYNDARYNCCDNLSIFEDLSIEMNSQQNYQEMLINESSRDNSNCDLLWYQANIVLKGFKECFINNVSATELW